MQRAVDSAPVITGSEPPSWTRHRTAIVASYVAVSAVLVAILGFPDRPYILIWVVVLVVVACAGSTDVVRRFLMDWLPILVIAAGYDFVRSVAPDLVHHALVEPQLRFDEILFFGTAPTVRLQRAVVDPGTPHWWDYIAFCFYLSHFVFTFAVAAVLYVKSRERFRRLSKLILAVSIAGFVTYLIVPAVPPWLASRYGDLPHTTRVVHAVWADLGFHDVARSFHGNAQYANPVAALPSLHAAWPFMVLLFLWPTAGRWRWALVAYNVAMVLTLIYGAEHYVSDILLGWLYAGLTFIVVNRVLDMRERKAHGEPRPVRA